jgi:hypothetical protein
MSTTDKSSSKDANKPNDLAWAFVGAVLFGVPALIVGGVTTGWTNATDWLLAHEFLGPATADPVLPLPATDGAGLDGMRIAVAVGALAVLSLAIRVVVGAVAGTVARHTPVNRRR